MIGIAPALKTAWDRLLPEELDRAAIGHRALPASEYKVASLDQKICTDIVAPSHAGLKLVHALST